MAQENSLRGTVKLNTVDALPGPSHAQNSCITTVEVWSSAGSTGGPINRMKLLPMLQVSLDPRSAFPKASDILK